MDHKEFVQIPEYEQFAFIAGMLDAFQWNAFQAGNQQCANAIKLCLQEEKITIVDLRDGVIESSERPEVSHIEGHSLSIFLDNTLQRACSDYFE